MAPITTDKLAERLERAYPELATVREAAGNAAVYVVGGAVRDLLLERHRTDLDLTVVGEAAELARRLGADPVEHERFATAKVTLDGHEVDVASARAETYSEPGALPDVEPAADIETDLARRDFTVNAMAVRLDEPDRLVDPNGGLADIEAGLLRVLHPGSFTDDPTRALRAARYAARYDFALEPETARALVATDLATVSKERREADLLRLAGEPAAARGFELLGEWGLLELRPGGIALAERVVELLTSPPWRGVAARDRAVLAAATGSPGGEEALAAATAATPSQGVELAGRVAPIELVLARALGADWLDRYLSEWRTVRLEIDGADLLAAGVPEGPALGRGLSAALRRKLDGEIAGREAELAAALAAARKDEG